MNKQTETLPGDAPKMSVAEVKRTILGPMTGMLLAALDQTIVVTALPTIGEDLGDIDLMPWVVTSYLLCATAVTPLYGKFGDIKGRRVAILLGLLTFLVGSVACALAPNMISLIIARGLQGLGGGGLIALAQTVLADVSAPRDRGRYQIYFASVFASASLGGPVLGGFFAEHLHWSMIFWINIPIGLIAMWMTNKALKKLPVPDRSHRLDFVGAALIASAAIVFMLALTWGGTRFEWLSLQTLGLFGASAVLWVLFGLRIRTAAEPLIPLTVARNPVVRTATIAASFGLGTLIGLTVYVPVYFEVILGFTAGQSGLALIPLMLGTVVGATFAGRMMARVDHYKMIPIFGLSLAIAGAAIMAVFPVGIPFVLHEIIFAAMSMGMGTVLPIATVSIQNAVERREVGAATASMNFFRQLGSALLTAVFGAIVIGGAGGEMVDVAALRAMGDSGGLAESFRWVFAAACLGFVISLAALRLMEERPLRG